MSFKKAALWTVIWVSLALVFNIGIYLFWPDRSLALTKAFEFLTGYVIELSLSMDNLFLFLTLFSFFCIEPKYQRRVLNYGIIGAIILRLAFILIGVNLVKKFEWILYIFGAILIFTSFKIIFGKDEHACVEDNWCVRLFKKIMPVTTERHGEKFFVRINGVLHATTLFLVLITIESTDILFAIDSIPAVFAVTTDPFIVYTSNIFAIMGLRSLYFFIEKVQKAFKYVKQGVGIILFITGVKMLGLVFHFKMPVPIALGLIVAVMAGSIIASIISNRRSLNAQKE